MHEMLYFFPRASAKLQNYVSSTSAHLQSTSLLIFTSSHLHLSSSSSSHIYISAHLHICTSIFTSSHLTSLPLIYISLEAGSSTAGAPRNATLCGDRARRAHEMQARVRFVSVRRNPLRRSCVSSARNGGETAIAPVAGNPLRRSCVSTARNAGASAICLCPSQPSAEIVRSSARNAGETAICPGRGQPSAEIVRVECTKCRRERFGFVAGNPLRGSCVSSARNAGESTI